VIGKDGVVKYAEQTPTPKDLPNFAAVKAALAKSTKPSSDSTEGGGPRFAVICSKIRARNTFRLPAVIDRRYRIRIPAMSNPPNPFNTLQTFSDGATHRTEEIPVRRRAHRAAGFHRRAAAGGPGGDALRGARLGKNPKIIEPLVPVDLVVDHSVQVDFAGTRGRAAEEPGDGIPRNRERYQFLKWGMQAFDTFKVVPPGIGIVHQVNLEYLAKGVLNAGNGVYYPDTLVGTDSHTTMINGLGIVGWGVGGIEAEAGMLGQPVYFLTPDVVGVHLTGALREGVTATDLALTSRRCCARRRSSASSSSSSAPARRRCRWWTARPSPTWRPNTARRWASSRSTPSA
jgi:hypothetical protein